jgi:hypothetical protein
LRKVASSEAEAAQYQVIGIIDLESWNVNHFTGRMVAEVMKIALDLGEINYGL